MDQSTIGTLVSPIAESRGLEVDRIDVQQAGRRSIVRIFLDGDGPRGRGPSLDEIADATRAISVALDEAPWTGNQPYTLEVSSRGVSRPLTEPRHFRRNTSRLIEATLADGSIVTGRILSTTATHATLDVEGQQRSFPFTELTNAVVQIELNRRLDDDEDSEEEGE